MKPLAETNPYLRDPETLARPWAVPGTPGLEHRIGGLEKADILGNVSYDPENHHRMQLLRAEKVARIANDIPDLQVYGPQSGDLLILGWGSTYGAIRSAVERLQAESWLKQAIKERYGREGLKRLGALSLAPDTAPFGLLARAD